MTSELAPCSKDKTKNNDRLSTSLRYSTTAGEMAMLVNGSGLTEEKAHYREQFMRHRGILEKLMKSYTGHDRKYLQDNLNYLQQYSDNLGE